MNGTYKTYKEYWELRGEYGKERLRRSAERKERRKQKGIKKREQRRSCGHSWYDYSSPTGYTQNCDYFGTCASPCNGDC